MKKTRQLGLLAMAVFAVLSSSAGRAAESDDELRRAAESAAPSRIAAAGEAKVAN